MTVGRMLSNKAVFHKRCLHLMVVLLISEQSAISHPNCALASCFSVRELMMRLAIFSSATGGESTEAPASNPRSHKQKPHHPQLHNRYRTGIAWTTFDGIRDG